MAIGYAYEAIKDGYQDLRFGGGGADDLHPTIAGLFGILNAGSKDFNDSLIPPRGLLIFAETV
jgi:3-oxoacyl-(acyl-carrier-protein) synthase